MDGNGPLQLVYYNCRGMAQYFRYIAYEIGVPLEEIHIGNDGQIPQYLQPFDISVPDLPCLIYKGRVFKELYPTIRFLCQHFNRSDLLGSNLEEQVRNSIIRPKEAKFIVNLQRKKGGVHLFYQSFLKK